MDDFEKLKLTLLIALLKPIYRARAAKPLPENPKTGKWYRITPPNCVCANGAPYHACIRLGKENKMLIVFNGGGVSVNAYTAARPGQISNVTAKESFYFEDVDLIGDPVFDRGILRKNEHNPFSEWTIVSICYASGDFHTGTADYPYTAMDGTPRILHHHGYTNYRAVMEQVKSILPNPETLVVTGFSAGGFGAALLTDDVMGLFPSCEQVTCCVDGALLLYDWKHVATDVWKAPKEICDRLESINITSDALKALHRKHGDKVKVLFISSVRDGALAQQQNFYETNHMVPDKPSGEKYQADLRKMCEKLMEETPNIGLYIFDVPIPRLAEFKLTQHTIIFENNVDKPVSGGVSALSWLWNAVNGKVTRVGLDLLDKVAQQ